MGYYNPKDKYIQKAAKRDKERYDGHVKNILRGRKVIDKLHSLKGKNRNARIILYLRKIDHFVFEELILNRFKSREYRIRRSMRYTGDSGWDGRIFDKDNNLICIQVKRYSNYVKPQHLREFMALIEKRKAFKGLFIHTGKTGVETYRRYKDSKIEIISGQKLVDLILNSNK